MSPMPDAGDVKPNVANIKRSTTPAEQAQGTPNPAHSLTPNPVTPNPHQPPEVMNMSIYSIVLSGVYWQRPLTSKMIMND